MTFVRGMWVILKIFLVANMSVIPLPLFLPATATVSGLVIIRGLIFFQVKNICLTWLNIAYNLPTHSTFNPVTLHIGSSAIPSMQETLPSSMKKRFRYSATFTCQQRCERELLGEMHQSPISCLSSIFFSTCVFYMTWIRKEWLLVSNLERLHCLLGYTSVMPVT